MSDSAHLLAQLRDVREPLPPEAVSLWLIVANAAMLVFIILLLWHRARQRRNAWRKQCIACLKKAYDKPAQEAIGIAATALRQLMLYRGHNIETLSGKPWLEQLDITFDTQWFTAGEGRVFGEALYQPDINHVSNVHHVLDGLVKRINVLPSHEIQKAAKH